MDGARPSASVFWLQDTASLNEAAQLSAQVKQQANFGSALYKPSTLDDVLENVQQSKKKSEISTDDDYWNSSGQVGFSFDDDRDDGKRATSPQKNSRQSASEPRPTGIDRLPTDLKHAAPSVLSAHPSSSPQSRHADLGDIQKHAESLRIASHVSPAMYREACVTPEDTVKNIIIGQPYFLEQHRSKEDKVALLNEAVRLQDGNAIIAVVLFLKQTLKPALFNQELMQRPKAVSHYISYLRLVQDNTQLMDVLG